MKKVNIVQDDLSKFNNIDEYLLHTYGEKKLQQSMLEHSPTFLDVIGYTLNKRGFETVERKCYELDEIEEKMNGNIEIDYEEDEQNE